MVFSGGWGWGVGLGFIYKSESECRMYIGLNSPPPRREVAAASD